MGRGAVPDGGEKTVGWADAALLVRVPGHVARRVG
jgi:hypothetical protein